MPVSGLGISIRISRNLFPNCVANMSGISRDAVNELMDYAIEEERGRVPVATGSLRDSIRKIMTGQSSGVVRAGGGTRRGTGEPIDYAFFQEYGTVYNAAHPFVRPAVAYAASMMDNLQATQNMESRLLS